MAELTADGYTALRNGPPVDDWFLELRDELDDPVPIVDPGDTQMNRVSAADARMTATDDGGNQTMVLELALTGVDVSPDVIVLPITVEAVVAYAADSGGNPLAVEALTPFVFGEDTDEATFTLRVEVPQQEA